MTIEQFDIRVYDGGKLSNVAADIIREIPVEIILNDQRVVIIACTGIHLKELTVGFLRSEGVIETLEDIKKAVVFDEEGRVDIFTKKGDEPSISIKTIASSGSRGNRMDEFPERALESDIAISPDHVLKLMDNLLNSSKLHSATRGTHCSALADINGVIVSREDIGRHNTVDMLGGYSLLEEVDCSDKIIVTTGRVSSEIATKVWKMGIPIIMSRSAPTSRAITLAKDAGITIIGYVRDGKFRVYSHEERVVE
ncbi:MAG: formate dehydrogenase accessory sulfurtransferase FdhD [Thermodesulfobacteriota bacterium]|nr:formate dehydrogenase accessory sulfurtransferase FdhD [Thermodesulfobacteriota bacterium]